MIFCVDEAGALEEISHGVACRNARFVFDKPVIMDTNSLLELIDGQWYKVVFVDGQKALSPLDGKWDR